MRGQQLCQAGSREGGFGGDVDGRFGKTAWIGQLRGQQERQKQLRFADTTGTRHGEVSARRVDILLCCVLS